MKPTYLDVSGSSTMVVEPDAPSVPVYSLSVYLERCRDLDGHQLHCLVLRPDPQLSQYRGVVVEFLRRALYREEKALHLGGRRVELSREDIFPTSFVDSFKDA